MAADGRVELMESWIVRRLAVSSIAWLDLGSVRRVRSANAVVISIKTTLQPAIVTQERETKGTEIHQTNDNKNSCRRADKHSTNDSKHENEESYKDSVQDNATPSGHRVEAGNALFTLWRVERLRSIVPKASAKILSAELCNFLPNSSFLLPRNMRPLPADVWNLE